MSTRSASKFLPTSRSVSPPKKVSEQPWYFLGTMQEEAEVAAQTNNVQAMEDMIKKNPNAKLDKLLAIATLYNSVPLVNHLIGKLTIHDLDCKKFTSVGDLMTTLLDLASQKNNLDVAQIITENGANMKDDKPLTAAVREGHVDMVRLLLNKGTDIAGRGGWVKYKPLVAAATKGHKVGLTFSMSNCTHHLKRQTHVLAKGNSPILHFRAAAEPVTSSTQSPLVF